MEEQAEYGPKLVPLHVHGFPDSIKRTAKIWAIEHGISLKELVMVALVEYMRTHKNP